MNAQRPPKDLAQEMLEGTHDPEQKQLLEGLLSVIDVTTFQIPRIPKVGEKSGEPKAEKKSRKRTSDKSSLQKQPLKESSTNVVETSPDKIQVKEDTPHQKKAMLEDDLAVSTDDDTISVDVAASEVEKLLEMPTPLSPLNEKRDHEEVVMDVDPGNPLGLEDLELLAWTVADIVRQTVDSVTSTIIAGIQRD